MNASVEKQIKQLNKLGIEIGDQKELGRFLLMNNFDTVMKIFGRCFMNIETQSYKVGTRFEEIMALHHYDEEIRGAMLKATLISEFHLKSVISNVFTSAHKVPGSFLKPKYFSNLDPTKVSDVLGKIRVAIENINESQDKNAVLTLTEVFNNTEFSLVKRFYGIMIKSDRDSVASQFSNILHDSYLFADNIKEADLEMIIVNLHQLRNTLAHNNQLYGFKAENKPPYYKSLHQFFGILPANPRTDLFNTLLMIQPFVESNQFAIMYNTLIKRSKSLNSNLKGIDINIVYEQMGFPANFHQFPKLVQGIKSKAQNPSEPTLK